MTPLRPAVPVATAVSPRRRAVLAVTLVAGSTLLWATFHTTRGDVPFWLAGFGLAAVWIAGALGLGGVAPGRITAGTLLPAGACGLVAFALFDVARHVLRGAPLLGPALDRVSGTAASAHVLGLVALAVVNSVAEEVFFRGALVAIVGETGDAGEETGGAGLSSDDPRRGRSLDQVPWRTVAITTALYAVVTAAAGNVALVIAAVVMGTVFAVARWWGTGVAASTVCHAVWSTLMLVALR
jgi:membrane protease YdiL (CAAX protease family)